MDMGGGQPRKQESPRPGIICGEDDAKCALEKKKGRAMKRLCAVKTYPRVPVRRLFFSLKAVSRTRAGGKHALAGRAAGGQAAGGLHRRRCLGSSETGAAVVRALRR